MEKRLIYCIVFLVLVASATAVSLSDMDFDGNGRITIGDIIELIKDFGKTSNMDLTNDQKVNLFDIVVVAKNIGKNVDCVGCLVFEAEDGTLSSPFSVGNGYVYQTIQTDEVSGGRASYTFNIEQADNYVIKTMVDAADTASDSFFVNIDGEPTSPDMTWDIIPLTNGFEERTVSWRGSGAFDNNEFVPKVFTLSAGEHELVIRGREPNTLIDRFEIASYNVAELVCGDGTCDPDESCSTCYQDCGSCPPANYCGNGLCDSGETCSNCQADCGNCPPANYCGDGTCDYNEDCNTCYQDCGQCPSTDAELLFKSGFESNTAINNKLIVGFDESTGYDWARLSRSRYQVSPPMVDPYVPKATDFYFYNEGGTNEIIDGSIVGRPGKVMKFKVYPPDGKRSSVHMYFDESKGWTLGYTFRYMMYISPSFNAYKGSSAYVDPMIFEWKSSFQATNMRGHIRIYMSRENEFYWIYRTQEVSNSLPASQWPVITYVENKDIPVPIGRWFLLDIYLKEGEGTDGRLVFRIDGQEVFDLPHSTVNVKDPQPLRVVFPLKLYSFWSEDHDIVDDISYYFDDFEVWRGLPPAIS